MSKAGERLIAGAQEARAIARGEEAAVSVYIAGHRYVPAGRLKELLKTLDACLSMQQDDWVHPGNKEAVVRQGRKEIAEYLEGLR